MEINSADEWADALDVETERYATVGDLVSTAYADGSVCGVSLDTEADDNYGRQLKSAEHGWVVRYDESNGYWWKVED